MHSALESYVYMHSSLIAQPNWSLYAANFFAMRNFDIVWQNMTCTCQVIISQFFLIVSLMSHFTHFRYFRFLIQ